MWTLLRVVWVALILSLAPGAHSAPPPPIPCVDLFSALDEQGFAQISFPSGRLRIGASLDKPKGAGPFPAYIHTHGGIPQRFAHSPLGALPSVDPGVAHAGYVVLRIARRGHFGSDGAVSAYQGSPTRVRVDQLVQLLYEEATDVAAAVAFLRQCPFVNPQQIAIGGLSTGGFISLVAAARLPDLGAVVSINGGISWMWDGVQEGHDATKRMFEREAPKINAPTLVLIGFRDQQLPPSIGVYLAETLRRHGRSVDLRIYQGGHGDWPATELISFLDQHLKPRTR